MKVLSPLLVSSLLAFFGLTLLSGCEGDTRTEEAPTATASAETWFAIPVGGKTVQMQLAVRSAEMRRGLMHRDELAPNHGMIFVYTRPQTMSFYMRNTRIPLDIGFFDPQGVLREVHRMFPGDIESTVSRGSDIQFALEMNQGWFAAQGVTPGAQLDLPVLARALQARGFSPADYGLIN